MRKSAIVYATSSRDRETLAATLKQHRFAVEVLEGTLADAADASSAWSVCPDFLFVDLNGVENTDTRLEELAASAPSGECNVVAIGCENDVAVYRTLRRKGVAEYLMGPVAPAEVDALLSEISARRLGDGLDIDPQRLICVHGVRGGSGASSVAAAVAYAVAEEHRVKSLLIDFDVSSGTQYLQFGFDPTMGLIEMLEQPERIDSIFFERVLERPYPSLSVLSCHQSNNHVDVNTASARELIVLAQRSFETVIVDLPWHPQVGLTALADAGLVLLVAPASIPGLRDATNTLNWLQQHEFAGSARVLVSRSGETRQSLRATDFARRLAADVFELPYDAITAMTAFNQSKPLVQCGGPLAKQMQKLTDTLPTRPQEERKRVRFSLFG